MARHFRTPCTILLPLLLILMLTGTAQAQYEYVTNNGTLTITRYTGPGGAVTIPNEISGLPVTSIGGEAFWSCTSLTAVYFQGSALSVGLDVFSRSDNVIVYYLPGTTGWGQTFAGRPTAFWYQPNPAILTIGPSFGVQSNGFGFIISWATNAEVLVEAASNLSHRTWSPVATNTLTDGWSHFSDRHGTNYPARFYRLRSL